LGLIFQQGLEEEAIEIGKLPQNLVARIWPSIGHKYRYSNIIINYKLYRIYIAIANINLKIYKILILNIVIIT